MKRLLIALVGFGMVLGLAAEVQAQRNRSNSRNRNLSFSSLRKRFGSNQGSRNHQRFNHSQPKQNIRSANRTKTTFRKSNNNGFTRTRVTATKPSTLKKPIRRTPVFSNNTKRIPSPKFKRVVSKVHSAVRNRIHGNKEFFICKLPPRKPCPPKHHRPVCVKKSHCCYQVCFNGHGCHQAPHYVPVPVPAPENQPVTYPDPITQPVSEVNEPQATFVSRFLKLKNESNVALIVYLRLRICDPAKGWYWFPGDENQAIQVNLQPGQEVDITDAQGKKVETSRIRIWAESKFGAWTDFRDQDLWVVPETVANGEHRYTAPQRETFTFVFPGSEGGQQPANQGDRE